MSVSYTYSIINDTLSGGVISDKLYTEISTSSISSLFEHIDTHNDNLIIWFSSSLSPADQTILTNIVNAHNSTSAYITRGNNNTYENSVVGWPNPSQITLSWDNNTRTLTVTPTGASFTFITSSAIFTRMAPESVQISNTSGEWYIYYNTSGILTASTTFFDLLQHAPVAIVYWNASLSSATHVLYELHGDARYTPAMNKRSHIYLHNSLGTVYKSGLDISANALLDGYLNPQDPNADNRNTWLSLTGGNILDEDIDCTITNGTNSNAFTQDLGTYPFPASAPSASNAAKIPVIYKLGSDGYWAKLAATNWPFPWNASTNKIQYNQNNNGTYQLTDVPDGYFSVLCVIATPDIYDPVIIIPHNDVFELYDDAVGASIHDIIPTRSSAAGPEYKVFLNFPENIEISCNIMIYS